MSHKNRVKFPVCPNCQYTFPEDVNNYCPNCGQENHDLNVPAGHLLEEVLENTLHFDTKFFRTVKYLLFYPGKLTNEFIANRRASYVPPFRLYVFISFFFFLLAAINKDKNALEKEDTNKPVTVKNYKFENGKLQAETKVEGPAKGKKKGIALNLMGLSPDSTQMQTLAHNPSDQTTDSILVALGGKPTTFNRFALKRVAKFSALSSEERDHKILKTFSLMMFFLMPFFALLLKGFYYRRHRHYIEHLIFSIHFHCFAFVLFSIIILINYYLDSGWLKDAMFLLPILYLAIMLKKVFKQGLFKTIFKTMLLLLVYAIILALAILASMVLTAILL